MEEAVPAVASAPAPREVAFEFRATGSEYFRIWIVNLLLTIVTLGIYSAWAKVRRLRYFYGSTALDGTSFDYHADPKAILKGRLIAVLAYVVFTFAGRISPLLTLALLPALMFAVPWLVLRSRRFHLRMTSWRGLRFHFHGEYRQALAAYVGWVLLGSLTLGILIPPSVSVLAYRAITAHSISLFGQRIHKKHQGADVLEYRFAIQNNEDEPLVNQWITVEVLDYGGQFSEVPNVFLGCNGFEAELVEPARSTWKLKFDELPAYDTWTVVALTNRAALNIRMTVSEGEAKLSGNRLFLPGDRPSVMTGQTTTEWWWASLALALGLFLTIAGRPAAHAALTNSSTDLAVLDHVDGTVTLIANAINYDNTDERVDAAWDDACRRLDAMQRDLMAPSESSVVAYDASVQPQSTRETPQADYLAAVETAKERIRAGDAFQVVLSQRFTAPCAASATAWLRPCPRAAPGRPLAGFRSPSLDPAARPDRAFSASLRSRTRNRIRRFRRRCL